MKKKFKLTILILTILVIFITCYFVFRHNDESKLNSNESYSLNESESINVKDIWDKYDKDPNKNEPVYYGDYILATGYVKYLGTDDHGTPSIELSSIKNGKSYVLAVFDSYDEFKNIKKDDLVSISGYFHIMSSSNMVVIKKAKIEKIY